MLSRMLRTGRVGTMNDTVERLAIDWRIGSQIANSGMIGGTGNGMTHKQPAPTKFHFRVRTLLLAVALIAVLFSVPSVLTMVWQTLQDTTYYSPGYSEWNFRSIRLGMQESEVIRLLGQPLQADSDGPRITWYYGPSTLRVSDDGGMWDTSGTFDNGRDYTVVSADEAGRVVNSSGSFLAVSPGDLVGQLLPDVRKRFGDPRSVRDQPSSKYLVYSGTKVSGSYYTRRIGFDAKGRVNNLVAGWYQD